MGRLLPILIVVIATVFTLIVIVMEDAAGIRLLPKWLWFIVVLLIPVIGVLAWWIFGRPLPGGPQSSGPPRAPDDDPDFLRSL